MSSKYIFLFSSVAILILWQLFLPGYILTTDMVFVPDPELLVSSSGYLSIFPLSSILVLLENIFPAWLVQKVLLFFLFFSCGYISFRFLPGSKNITARLFAALLYTLNPFVYERFLAGQWLLLFGYAFLPLFFHFLLKWGQETDKKNTIFLVLSLFLLSIFSLHIFVMSVLVFFIYAFFYLKTKVVSVISIGFSLVLLCSYWILPAIFTKMSLEQRFDNSHWTAFSATGNGIIPTPLNVLSLSGFWAEGGDWAKQFIFPQLYSYFWVVFFCIFVLVVLGIVDVSRDSQKKSLLFIFLPLGIFSYIFAIGVGDTIFKGFNFWFYEHIGFWRGFRDSQKFTAFLLVVYSVFASFGVEGLLNLFERNKKVALPHVKVFLLCLPVLFGFFMWGGFRGQLRSVHYPASWYEAKKILGQDRSSHKTLFLPWHGYLSFEFNNNLLLANPARAFFGEKAVVSKNIELRDIYDQEISEEYKLLDSMVRGPVFYPDKSFSPDETINFFLQNNIQYIVLFQDLEGRDVFSYSFLSSSKIYEILKTDDLILYKIISP